MSLTFPSIFQRQLQKLKLFSFVDATKGSETGLQLDIPPWLPFASSLPWSALFGNNHFFAIESSQSYKRAFFERVDSNPPEDTFLFDATRQESNPA